MLPANWCASFLTLTLDNPWLDERVVAVRKELDFFGQRRNQTRNCYEEFLEGLRAAHAFAKMVVIPAIGLSLAIL